METHERDIVIVGAGPAGSSAAIAACRSGLRVLLIERKAAVGTPVRCAEYIPAPLLGELDLPGRRFVEQHVLGMRTVLPGGEMKVTRSPGYTIKRDLFDQCLVERAAGSGAEIWLSTRVLERDGEGLLVRDGFGVVSTVKAKTIIGADGPQSTVGRWIGSVNRNLIPAVQVRAPLRSPLDFTEVYFDREIRGGYGWLFPKGNTANVGIGLKGKKGTGPGMKGVLKRFLARLESDGKVRSEAGGCVAGWIPAERPRPVTRGNFLLAGDAAGQTHPISGAGISQAVMCGRMAGAWAARAVAEQDPGLLAGYEEEWRDLYGEAQERAFERRQFLEREWDRLEAILPYCWVGFREYYAGSR